VSVAVVVAVNVAVNVAAAVTGRCVLCLRIVMTNFYAHENPRHFYLTLRMRLSGLHRILNSSAGVRCLVSHIRMTWDCIIVGTSDRLKIGISTAVWFVCVQ
jgi:hypothetical protein